MSSVDQESRNRGPVLADQHVECPAGRVGFHDLDRNPPSHDFRQYGNVREMLIDTCTKQNNIGVELKGGTKVLQADFCYSGRVPVRDNLVA